MQTTGIPHELKQMNRYWYMLAATLNEIDIALNQGNNTPEDRLAKVRALYDHMRRHMPPAAPPSIAAEAGVHETEQTRANEAEVYYRHAPDGSFDGPFMYTAEDGAPFTPEEDAMMRTDWENDHARRNNVA